MPDDLAALRLLLEWGADEALADEPVDRLGAAGHGHASPAPPPVRAMAPAVGAGPPGERALAAAAAAASLEALRAAVAGFEGCPLRHTATSTVLPEGDPAARVVLVGEPPGRDEDRNGRPFAGAEGLLLDQMLASIGLSREGLLLAHLLPWRPPGGRPPHPGELALCLPFLHRLLVLARPERVLLLGGLASRALLGRGVSRRRGTKDWVAMTVPGLDQPVPALGLPGLAELLRTPALKREAWAGLRLLRRTLNALIT